MGRCAECSTVGTSECLACVAELEAQMAVYAGALEEIGKLPPRYCDGEQEAAFEDGLEQAADIATAALATITPASKRLLEIARAAEDGECEYSGSCAYLAEYCDSCSEFEPRKAV